MAYRQLQSLHVDKLLHGYRVKKLFDVAELKLSVAELHHVKTGAQHFHLIRNDPNKTFSVQFRTTPKDSTGVAHILEHTSLCGSIKYPVRDPFFKMLTRSQATFMNAFTASDWTMYPFSTLNEADFKNLLSVYMDAVLRPKLTELDFMQEGWRLEPENLQNLTGSLTYKGVVYNEMKGVFSNSQSLFAQAVENNLLPVTYRWVSGGHPTVIPALSWQQLRQFHADYYHPSNARFYTYGDLQLEKYLDLLNSEYLGSYEARQVDSAVPLEPRWSKPREVHLTCPPNPMAADPERQAVVAVSFLLDDIRDGYRSFLLGLVSSLLVDGDNAPLFRGLIETGLGLDWSHPVHGYDKSARTTSFSVGLQGVRSREVADVQAKIRSVLMQVALEGFDPARIESALHQIELNVRHDTPRFGLNLIMGLSSCCNHDADPEGHLQINRLVQRFRQDLSDHPDLLQRIVQNSFLENQHRLTTVMEPEASYLEKQAKEEAERLAGRNSALSDAEKRALVDKARQLEAQQNCVENIDCLPTLQLSDIPLETCKEPFMMKTVSKCPVQANEANTNGLIYLKMFSDLADLPQELLPYVPLFAILWTGLGADGLTYLEMSQAIEQFTGGLSASPHLNPQEEGQGHRQGLVLSSHCLHGHNVYRMMELWTRLFIRPNWADPERLATLIHMQATGEWSAGAISGQGHALAMRRAMASLSPIGRLSELWLGLEQGQLVKGVAAAASTTGSDLLIDRMRQIGKHALNPLRLSFAINGDAEGIELALNRLDEFMITIRDSDEEGKKAATAGSSSSVANLPSIDRQCHFAAPFSVNFTGQAVTTVPFRHPQFPSFQVLAQLMSSKFLHKEIREKGGAYGGGAKARPGYFVFYSYRDPRSSETLDTFRRAVDWAISSDITDQQLTEAKLAVFQELDMPVSAGSRGLTHFLQRLDDESRQAHRDRLFRVTLASVREAASSITMNNAGATVIGPATDQLKDWSHLQLE